MPDISMCRDRECPSRGECYRYRARPGVRQSYESFYRDDDVSCAFYYPVGLESSAKSFCRPVSEVDSAIDATRSKQ